MFIQSKILLQWACRYSAAIALLAVLVSFTAPAAQAQSAEFNRASISLGVFVTSRNSRASLDGEVPGSGTDVNLEGDLGLDRNDSVFRIDGYYRFNDKHRLDFSAFDLSRSSSKQIQEEVDWDGTVYPIDTVIRTNFDLKIYKLAYTWSFLRKEKAYLGATAGLYVADVQSRLAADNVGAVSGNGVTAPLPVVGLRGQYNLSDKWALRGSTEIFSIDYNEYTGSLYDYSASVDYRLSKHAAVGIGYNTVKFKVGIGKPKFNGDLNWRYGGALLFVKFDF